VTDERYPIWKRCITEHAMCVGYLSLPLQSPVQMRRCLPRRRLTMQDRRCGQDETMDDAGCGGIGGTEADGLTPVSDFGGYSVLSLQCRNCCNRLTCHRVYLLINRAKDVKRSSGGGRMEDGKRPTSRHDIHARRRKHHRRRGSI
jgi:hypothetical protein